MTWQEHTVVKIQSLSIFLNITKLGDFWQKYWCQQNSKGVSCDFYIFWTFFKQGISVPSFIIFCRILQILGRGSLTIPPPIHEQQRKGPSWIGLRQLPFYITIGKVFLLLCEFFFQQRYAVVYHLQFVRVFGNLRRLIKGI